MNSILLVGCGGHAMACIDVIEEQAAYGIRGLVGQRHEIGRLVLGYEVLGADDDLARLAESVPNAIIAVGQIKTPDPRIRLFEQVRSLSFGAPTIVSPHAHVSRHATIGEGTIVMHGAVVNAGARIGRNCIINSQALIEHDAEVGDHCHIATAAALNSSVVVGSGSFVGSGARVRQGVTIGERCFIAMGQSIIRDCSSGMQVRGGSQA